MKKFLLVFSVILIGSMVFYSCFKDHYAPGPITEREKSLVAWMQEYFENNATTLNYPVMGGAEAVSRSLGNEEVIVPYWDKASVYSDSLIEVVNVPLDYTTTRYAAKSYIGKKGNAVTEKTPWYSHISISQSKQGGVPTMTVVTIIPQWKYGNKNESKALRSLNAYELEDDYSGYVLFSTLEGEFMYGYIYAWGEKTHRILANSPEHAHDHGDCSCEGHDHGDEECADGCGGQCRNDCAAPAQSPASSSNPYGLDSTKVHICLHASMFKGLTKSDSEECQESDLSPDGYCTNCKGYHIDGVAKISACERCNQKLDEGQTCSCCTGCGSRGQSHESWCPNNPSQDRCNYCGQKVCICSGGPGSGWPGGGGGTSTAYYTNIGNQAINKMKTDLSNGNARIDFYNSQTNSLLDAASFGLNVNGIITSCLDFLNQADVSKLASSFGKSISVAGLAAGGYQTYVAVSNSNYSTGEILNMISTALNAAGLACAFTGVGTPVAAGLGVASAVIGVISFFVSDVPEEIYIELEDGTYFYLYLGSVNLT